MVETVTETVERIGRYMVQTGTPGHFGWVRLAVEPTDRFEVIDDRAPSSADVDRRIFEAIAAALERFRDDGPAWGHPLHARIRVLESKTHPVDSRPDDFGRAAIVAVTDAVRARPRLLDDSGEPANTPGLRDWQLPRHHTVRPASE